MVFCWKNSIIILLAIAILTTGSAVVLKYKNYFVKNASALANNATGIKPENKIIAPPVPALPPPPEKLSEPPAIIKAVYVTGYSAGSKRYINYLSNLLNNTQINAVVIDIKGSSGYVTYASGAGDVKKYNLDYDAISDIDSLVRFLHNKNIYVIGRIAVFEDPAYSKARPELAVYNKEKTTDLSSPVLWQDNNGLSWLDPASKDVWDYEVSLAKDALYHGFDEINFDYVRFPTDGKIENMGFPIYDVKISKAEIIKQFFQYLRSKLADEKISVDLFGLTTVDTTDMGIGQVIENAFENFDYVCPMVYPSHYANGFIGFANPAEHPYDVIKYSLDHAVAKEDNFLIQAVSPGDESATPAQAQTQTTLPLAKLRPWLQDFNMGAVYTADMVDQEIKATQDSMGADYSGFMVWNPSNIYTESALAK